MKLRYSNYARAIQIAMQEQSETNVNKLFYYCLEIYKKSLRIKNVLKINEFQELIIIFLF